jgi:hypothetical protein
LPWRSYGTSNEKDGLIKKLLPVDLLKIYFFK